MSCFINWIQKLISNNLTVKASNTSLIQAMNLQIEEDEEQEYSDSDSDSSSASSIMNNNSEGKINRHSKGESTDENSLSNIITVADVIITEILGIFKSHFLYSTEFCFIQFHIFYILRFVLIINQKLMIKILHV